jgi:transcriptional regulator of heat shock response
MNERQSQVLKAIVEEFVKTHEPVASGQVVEMLPFEVSSATVRNDMTELAEAGLIAQPHTSAGRVPTEEGYRAYIQATMHEQKELSLRQRETLLAHFKKLKTLQERFREAAKMLSEMSGSVGLLIDESNQVYMSGLSKLPQLPEFRDLDFGEDFMALLEDPAVQMKKLTKEVAETARPQVLLGSDNPLADKASIVITKFGPNGKQIISVVGPVRMHYGKALPAMEYITKILNGEI